MNLSDIIDLPQLERLMQSLHRATGLPYALVDNESNVLVEVGWQDICTRFHRQNPITCSRCHQSDKYILDHLHDGPYVGYTCPQGLRDYATPLVIEARHVANVFTGQLLNAPPDREFFERQAEQFGFDKEAYLRALDSVPVLPEDRVSAVMTFLVELAQLLASNGLHHIRQAKAEEELRTLNEGLNLIVKERTNELTEANERLKDQIRETTALHEQIKLFAIQDPLTGLYNRRFLDEALARLVSQAERLEYPVSVAIADLDHFKEVNDNLGHQVGDSVLKKVASVIRACTRSGDIACRLGGDEFLLVFPGMAAQDTAERMEAVRQEIHENTIVVENQGIVRTISIGVATYPQDAQNETELIRAADLALYRAKHEGRDRVCKYETPTPPLRLNGLLRKPGSPF